MTDTSSRAAGKNTFARNCLLILAALIAIISIQNGRYFANGYFLHLVPLALACWAAFAVLRDDAPPAPEAVFWTLLAASAATVALELGFHIYSAGPLTKTAR